MRPPWLSDFAVIQTFIYWICGRLGCMPFQYIKQRLDKRITLLKIIISVRDDFKNVVTLQEDSKFHRLKIQFLYYFREYLELEE